MEIKVMKAIAEQLGEAKLKPFGVNKESWGWKAQAFIDLKELDAEKTAALRALLEANRHIHGVGVLLKDMATWDAALKTPGAQKARTIKQFEPLLIRVLGKSPGHRLYLKGDEFGDVWLAVYVDKIEYVPESKDRGYYHPAHVWMRTTWEQFGGHKQKTVTFSEGDCRGVPVIEALARKGYYIETPEMRAQYLKDAKRMAELTPQLGVQFLATGTGKDDLDGNPKGRDSSWYWRQTHNITMERNGEPARVVLDVFREEDERADREDRVEVDTWFWWGNENKKLIETVHHDYKDRVDSEDLADLNDADEGGTPEIEIPVHPFVAVFDLRRHLRIRIHVNYLTEYKYDRAVADKLILPAELKELVKMLIEHKEGTFKDIIAGKSGGAVVLLTGKPGVGKTLTAEVYAESEGRALYSVQASQLGTDPDDLEDELLKVFARSRRWNAVMLLDEADVYVRARGGDLQQNAIVGVFLRVLEYQSSVLFLTTNRPDDVDDAIASRCVARLCYATPALEDQKRIWTVLAEASGITLAPEVVDAIADANPNLTGRDVKNLLKLAALMASHRKEKITAETVEFVRRFKPTE
jgi:hypothetical protein